MFAPRWAERAVVTKPAKRYAKGAYQTRWPHRANNGEGDEVEMVEKYRRRFPAHTDDRAASVAASYLCFAIFGTKQRLAREWKPK
jgi:hypothetical protein